MTFIEHDFHKYHVFLLLDHNTCIGKNKRENFERRIVINNCSIIILELYFLNKKAIIMVLKSVLLKSVFFTPFIVVMPSLFISSLCVFGSLSCWVISQIVRENSVI